MKALVSTLQRLLCFSLDRQSGTTHLTLSWRGDLSSVSSALTV